MGRGYTSHNVWPVSSSSSSASSSSATANANANAKELSSKEELRKKEEDETDNKIADKIVKILTPLIESIKGLGQGKSGNDGKGDEVEKKLVAAQQREKVFEEFYSTNMTLTCLSIHICKVNIDNLYKNVNKYPSKN
jgi:hypothetical protein